MVIHLDTWNLGMASHIREMHEALGNCSSEVGLSHRSTLTLAGAPVPYSPVRIFSNALPLYLVHVAPFKLSTNDGGRLLSRLR